MLRRLVAAVPALVDRHVYRAEDVVVVRAALAGPPAADRAGDVVFRLATGADLGRLDELDRYGRGATQRAYVLQDRDWLFVACHGDRIVATRRYSASVRDPRVSGIVELRPGQIWVADIFALPEYRSQGIGRRLAIFSDRLLASRGYTELFAAVVAGNEASLRLSLGKGTDLVHYVRYRRVLGYEHVRVSTSALDRLQAFLNARRSTDG